jgi:hypothetical protein
MLEHWGNVIEQQRRMSRAITASNVRKIRQRAA